MFPILYEINTRCWLQELTARLGSNVTLANVPQEEFASWRRLGFTHIWLMGAWTTGPLARAQALSHSSLKQSYSEALPDWMDRDVTGSPYAIANYQVPEALGGEQALEIFRDKLHSCGLKLILDFVPNHVGIDHSWLSAQPELFVYSRNPAPETIAHQSATGTFWLAHGKDPYFSAWTDTVQLDYRRATTQQAMIELLRTLAQRCDGVRCDMAMLLLSDVFARTWERFPIGSSGTGAEFWEAAIPSIKSEHPNFLFLAEVYWGLEPRLLGFGFDFTYDKTLYDRIVHRDGSGVQNHLLGLPPELLARGAHFLENHDEPRIASLLSVPEQRAAALVILSLPGMRFLHQGQLQGAIRKVPVQLGRCIQEPAQPEIVQLYEQLLTCLASTSVGRGQSEVLKAKPAWPENPTAGNFVLVRWQAEGRAEFDLVAVNLAPHASQCHVQVTLPGEVVQWRLKDLLSDEQYERSTAEMTNPGLYLDLKPHQAQVFRCEPT